MGGGAGLEGGAVQLKPRSRFQDRHDARAQLSSPPHRSLSFYVTKQRNPAGTLVFSRVGSDSSGKEYTDIFHFVGETDLSKCVQQLPSGSKPD